MKFEFNVIAHVPRPQGAVGWADLPLSSEEGDVGPGI